MPELLRAGVVATAILVFGRNGLPAAARAAVPPDLTGVYAAISNDATLPGGLQNRGSPDDVVPTPGSPNFLKLGARDPARLCQPIGVFRMMAEPRMKMELVPTNGTVVMLPEDMYHGFFRTVYLRRSHPRPTAATWEGDSVGSWHGNTLEIDTIGLNGSTWLNEKGAAHSDFLHLVETLTPILGGSVLEFRMTASDRKAMAGPVSYVRYFAKTDVEVGEHSCAIDSN